MATRRGFVESCDSPTAPAVQVNLWNGQETTVVSSTRRILGAQQQPQPPGETSTSGPQDIPPSQGYAPFQTFNAQGGGGNITSRIRLASATSLPPPRLIDNPNQPTLPQHHTISGMNSAPRTHNLETAYSTSRVQGNGTATGSSPAFPNMPVRVPQLPNIASQPQFMITAYDHDAEDAQSQSIGPWPLSDSMIANSPAVQYMSQIPQVIPAIKRPPPPAYPLGARGANNQLIRLRAIFDSTCLRTTINLSAAIRLGLAVYVTPPVAGMREQLMTLAGSITVQHMILGIQLESPPLDIDPITASIVVLNFDIAEADIVIAATTVRKFRRQPAFDARYSRDIVDNISLQQVAPLPMMSVGTGSPSYQGNWSPATTPNPSAASSLRPPSLALPRSHQSRNSTTGVPSPIFTDQSVPVSSPPSSLSARVACPVHSPRPEQSRLTDPNSTLSNYYVSNNPQMYSMGNNSVPNQSIYANQSDQSYFGDHGQPIQKPSMDHQGFQ